MKENKITIYTNDTCPFCKNVKELLNNNNIEFENILTKENQDEWTTVVTLTGMAQLPVVKYKDEYFTPGRDFQNAEQVIKIYNHFKKVPFDNVKISLERIKTLSYNINTAFGRLDQLLKKIETKINTDEHESTD